MSFSRDKTKYELMIQVVRSQTLVAKYSKCYIITDFRLVISLVIVSYSLR